MTRAADERIRDILAAVERCISYRDYLDSDHSTMAYDAILRNLAVIGEAVRAYLAKSSRNIPTPRGHRSPGCGTSFHEYFKINPDLIRDVVDNDLAALAESLRDN